MTENLILISEEIISSIKKTICCLNQQVSQLEDQLNKEKQKNGRN